MTTPADIANAVAGAQKATVSVGSWPSWLTLLVVVATVARVWISGMPARRKAESDADTALREAEAAMRNALTERIDKLEKKIDDNEQDCQNRIDDAIKINDDRWEARFIRMQSEHKLEIEGLYRQMASLQADTGKVLRLAGGESVGSSTSMERVIAESISEITNKLDPQ